MSLFGALYRGLRRGNDVMQCLALPGLHLPQERIRALCSGFAFQATLVKVENLRFLIYR